MDVTDLLLEEYLQGKTSVYIFETAQAKILKKVYGKACASLFRT